MPSITRLFKIVTQLGIRELSLYALYKLGLKTGHYKRAKTLLNIKDLTFNEIFLLPSRELLLQTLEKDGEELLQEEADEIVAGKFRMFGAELTEIKLTANWQPAHWTDFELGKIKLAGDIKLIWEPARFGWTFTLGRAYHITQDNKYAESFWKYFETFIEANPVNIGPHWMNGQEVAIRLMAFVWALHIFPSTEKQKTEILESISRHAERIALTLIYARSQNNNHLVTESAALYTAGLLLKNETWRTTGWKWLNWSFQHQIGRYGEYIQHSSNYHRVMLQTALWINFIKQDVFPANSLQALSRSTHWLFSLLDNATGSTPNLGSNDGALILPLSGSGFHDYRPTVQAAARAFLGTNMPSGNWDETSLWLNLRANERIINPEDYLTDNVHGKNSWAYLRASTFKSRLGHMDQLHLDLWWHGLNIAQDAGTYMYNAEPPWDNPLVTTRVHNTVTVNGADQMTRAGRFMVLDWVNAYSKDVIETEDNILSRVRAYHKGYRPVKHERTVTAYQDERWVIHDEVRVYSFTERRFRLHWLLPDYEWESENRNSIFEIRLKSPNGWISLNIKFNSPKPNIKYQASLVRAGELIYGQRDVQPYEGWVSRIYGQKSPALSLAVEVESARDVEFISEFTFFLL